MNRFLLALGFIAASIFSPLDSEAIRLKDLTDISGVRDNQLMGYGIVVGLDGTGDLSTNIFFSVQSIVAMLEKMGVKVPAAKLTQLKMKNAASVMVTATLPPFARAGSKVDVMVSSLGDANSLQGGTLLMTPLKAANGDVYAVAQGPLSIGGFAAGRPAPGVQKNHPTVGRIAGGALIEKEVNFNFQDRKFIKLLLNTPDFTTSMRIVRRINMAFGENIAEAQDAGTLKVQIPEGYKDNSVQFVSMMENIQVTPDVNARVVLAERTGTIVMGAEVKLSTVAVSHGSLIIKIKEEELPPAQSAFPLAGGPNAMAPRNKVTGGDGEDRLLVLPRGTRIGEVVTALNSIGAKPKDLIAILQAIKAAGALQAELVIL